MNIAAGQNKAGLAKSLPHALGGNAIFSAVSGIIAVAGARPIAEFMGLPGSLPFYVLGAVLVLYAGLLFLAAARKPVDRRHGIVATVLDIGWVVGSIAILLVGWPELTAAGKWTVALLAEVVMTFALWQANAMGLLRRRAE